MIVLAVWMLFVVYPFYVLQLDKEACRLEHEAYMAKNKCFFQVFADTFK